MSEQRLFRVEVFYREPTYAQHSNRPLRTYRHRTEVRAATPEEAEQSALDEFHELEKASSVGWTRHVVKVVVREVRDRRSPRSRGH